MPSFTTSDGLRIVFHEFGEDTSRPPVVLHHGFASSATGNWVASGAVKALTDSGRRVIAVDASASMVDAARRRLMGPDRDRARVAPGAALELRVVDLL